MPLGSDVARNADLDANYGDNHASTWPDSFNLRVYDGDPTNGGAELTSGGGYAPLVVSNDSTNFPDADGGQKTSAQFQFADATDAWDEVGEFWVLEAGGDIYDYDEFDQPMNVTAAGAVPAVVLTIGFDQDTI